ncbi:MAG: dTDP-glucose 4,6-dehydratase [Thermoplasmata archaeon]
MAVLVTGGCGFIGSHLSEGLLERGHEVRVIGLRCDRQNMRSFQDDVSFTKVDVRNYEHVSNIVDDDIEAIYHLASLINVDESRETPMEFLQTNVVGTVNLLECARIMQVPQFIYMSSCEVYGNIPKGKANEKHPTEPRSPYAASKFAAERYILSYAHTYSGEPTVKIVRGFNQYGPRQNSGSRGAVIAKFAKALLGDEGVTIYGRGDQTRDYVFVKDTVDALVRVLEAKIPSGEIINVATGRDRAIRDIAWAMCEHLDIDPEERVSFIEERPGEIIRSCGDWTRARQVLGWKPRTEFEDGLEQTLAWFKQESAT